MGRRTKRYSQSRNCKTDSQMLVSRVFLQLFCFAVCHSLLTQPVLVCLTFPWRKEERIGDGPRVFRSRRCKVFDGKLREAGQDGWSWMILDDCWMMLYDSDVHMIAGSSWMIVDVVGWILSFLLEIHESSAKRLPRSPPWGRICLTIFCFPGVSC